MCGMPNFKRRKKQRAWRIILRLWSAFVRTECRSFFTERAQLTVQTSEHDSHSQDKLRHLSYVRSVFTVTGAIITDWGKGKAAM